MPTDREPDEAVAQNLRNMNELDFTGWNPPDWDIFRHFHTADVHVSFSGHVTDGLDTHVEAMKQSVEQNGGRPIQVLGHPISFGSGEWTCVVGDLGSGAAIVTVARWRDGAICEEYIWA